MSRKENDKKTIYPITVGMLEHKYLTKLFEESYNGKFKIVPEQIPCNQLDNKQTCKVAYLNTNIQGIKNRFERSDANISKTESIIVLITDKDSASLEMIQEFKNKFHSLFKEYDHHFFILNVKQFEYWLRHYYDHSLEDFEKNIGKIKSEMSQDISSKPKRWKTTFSGKHKNAKNKYGTVTGYSTEKSISDYKDIKKEYSDFPCFFYELNKWFEIEI